VERFCGVVEAEVGKEVVVEIVIENLGLSKVSGKDPIV